jgi:hypothetical protein
MTSRAPLASACCSAVTILAASLLSGCAANQPITLSDPPANITGNWEFAAQITTYLGVPFGVYLTSNKGNVSGTAVLPKDPDPILPNGCLGGQVARSGAARMSGAQEEAVPRSSRFLR